MNIFKTISSIILLSIITNLRPCSATTNTVQIICQEIESFQVIYYDDVLTCQGDESIVSSIAQSSVSSVVYSNKSEVENLPEITGLRIVDANVKFIPAGLKVFFPSLKALEISSCGLQSVDKADIKEFGASLECLRLAFNKISSISADLLEHNPNMRSINFYDNPIKQIGPNFFKNLKTLKEIEYVCFNDAGCMDQYFSYYSNDSGADIQTFEWDHQKCTTPSDEREPSLDEKIESLMAQMVESHKMIIALTSKIESFETKLEKIQEGLKEQIKDAKAEILENIISRTGNYSDTTQ